MGVLLVRQVSIQQVYCDEAMPLAVAWPVTHIPKLDLGWGPGRLLMIDPGLHDWWSTTRQTELRFTDGLISGAGISMRVIFPALLDLDLMWFSRIFGEYCDNIVMLAFVPAAVPTDGLIKHRGKTPLQSVWDPDYEKEYALTEEICAKIGMVFERNSCEIAQEAEVACQLYIHDDCFFFIKPANESIVESVLFNVLSQHSFYLHQAVDWSGVAADLRRTLMAKGRLQLQSDPRRSSVWIPQLDQTGLFWRSFRRGTVVVQDRKAEYRDASVHVRVPP